MAKTRETTRTKVVEEVVAPVEEPTVKGEVNGCDALNLRSSANISDNNIIGCLKEGSKVLIFPSESKKNFYKVITESGVEGFVSKDFIKEL